MPFVAILGAGPLGGALTYTLASRNRFDEVRLVDPSGTLAMGKALDVQQAGPPDGWSTRVSGYASLDACHGAWVLVLADVDGNAVELLRTVLPRAPGATLLCAAASHASLVRRLVGAGLTSPDAVAGSAPSAARSVAQALIAVHCDVSPADVFVSLCPADGASGLRIHFERTTIGGHAATDTLSRERLGRLDQLFARAWPPGPLALASAAARLAEAAWFGSRAACPAWLASPGGGAQVDSNALPDRTHPFLADLRFDPGGRLVRLRSGR